MAARMRILPRLVVNLKAYPQTLGRRAVEFCQDAAKLERETGIPMAVCPQAVDLRACGDTGARIYAQHMDRVIKPEATGWQAVEALKDAGCQGTLINHSEHRVPSDEMTWFVEAARKAGLVSVLCTRDVAESELYAKSRPDLVAIEPPELIGGDVSVTTADPEIVRRSVAAVARAAPGLPVLCGAGVKNGRDIAKALELGALGILVASGVAKSPRPGDALRELLSGFSAKPPGRPSR